MFGAIVVLWLGSSPELAQHRADIAAWASAHEYTVRAPEAASLPAYDASVAEQIEAWLEEARAAPELSVGSSVFEQIEALLAAHPELPQAAWLLAERYAIEAHALSAGGEAARERARLLLERSRQLEGRRALPLGLAPLPDAPSPAASAEAVPPPPGEAVAGVRPHDQLFIDGVEGLALGPGRHHVQLYRGSQSVWIGWVDASTTPALAVLPSPPCGALDLADVRVQADAPHPAPGIRCDRWLAARATPLGHTELAECSGSLCGPWLSAGALRALAVGVPAPGHDDRAGWPAWATWGLAGAGVLGAAGVVLWQAGVFDRSAPGTEFVFTGPSATAYRF